MWREAEEEPLSWDRLLSMRGHGEGDDMGSKASVQGRERVNGGGKETPHTSDCGRPLGASPA